MFAERTHDFPSKGEPFWTLQKVSAGVSLLALDTYFLWNRTRTERWELIQRVQSTVVYKTENSIILSVASMDWHRVFNTRDDILCRTWYTLFSNSEGLSVLQYFQPAAIIRSKNMELTDYKDIFEYWSSIITAYFWQYVIDCHQYN